MTPAQAKAVVEASPLDLLRGVEVHDITGMDGDRARLTATLAGVGTFTFEVPLLFGPLPLTPGELLAVVAMAQSRLGAVAAVAETDIGRGFNEAGRGAINTSQGYRAEDGYV